MFFLFLDFVNNEYVVKPIREEEISFPFWVLHFINSIVLSKYLP